MTTTLILPPRFTEDSQLLWSAASKRGWDTVRLHRWQVTDEIKALEDPVIYVEAMFAPMVAEELGIKFLEPAEDWLPKLPKKFSGRDIELTTFGEAAKRDGEFFCKPPNDKAFKAGVYSKETMPKGYEDSMPVLVQEQVTWIREFRCFAIGGKVVTASIYLINGVLQRESNYYCPAPTLQRAIDFANEVMAEVEVPPAVVIDVGQIDGKDGIVWGVVELNAAWGSGIYGCDPDKVLDVIQLCLVEC